MLLIYILIPSLTLTLALAIFLYFRLRKDSLAAYQKLHQTILLLKNGEYPYPHFAPFLF